MQCSFGGTNGFQWFNDVWCYDPSLNTWSQLDCIGYIPVPREGHAAALVDDVMYIFGGRTEEGADLGDLAAFRISSRRWYTFQNMGPSPSPRSGHSMTTVGKTVVVVGGEPSQAAPPVNDLSMIYMLDTTKIRYPSDSQIQSQQQRTPGQRRPSIAEPPAQFNRLPSRDGSNGPSEQRRPMAAVREGGPMNSPNGLRGASPADTNGVGQNGPPARAPRGPAGLPPSGPPPQGQPPRPGAATGARPSRNASSERNDLPTSQEKGDSPTVNGRRTPTSQAAKDAASGDAPKSSRSTRQTRGQGSVDSTTEPNLRGAVSSPPSGPVPAAPTAPASASAPASSAPAATATAPARPTSPPPPTRQPNNPVSRRSSMRNSQTVALLKELDAARNRNAWYASELELARKSGYVANASLSPVLDSRGTETFDEDDRPLIEALLAMRTEVANVQASLDKQAVLAAKHIAEAEKQRDAAILEAVHAKAKLAAQGGSGNNTPNIDTDREADERSNELGRKLATALNAQRELQNALDRMSTDVEAERRSRKIADDTVAAAEKRMAALEAYKQQSSSELEQLKAELHMVQREAREQSVLAHEAQAALQLLQADKAKFESQYNDAVGSSKDHSETLGSLREAIVASAETKALLESKLDEERALRETVESKLSKLKAEHEARTAELVSATQRLRDAEELAERHAIEARTHRQAVLAGLDKISARDSPSGSQADPERLAALQSQLDSANALVKRYQQEADSASDRLRGAEERIAGLEAYQEQASREGVTIRRQLQAALRETQSLQASNSDLKHQLANQQLEANAINVQHSTLKDILVERGISPTSALSRTRSITSPRGGSPELSRVRDLEKQLAASVAAHEETKQALSSQVQETDSQYREKLTQLENDYQSAVHYVKGTEKMLKQLKEQLARYKSENSRLKEELADLDSRGPAADGDAPSDWEEERRLLHAKVEELQVDMKASSAQLETQLQTVRQELADARRQQGEATRTVEEASARFAASKRELEQLQQENALLEQRAHDAENKVSMLLDQVENSVTTYRRQSRNISGMEPMPPSGAAGAGHESATNGGAHGRKESGSDAGSVYSPTLGEARNSAALDNLANELETLRSHWEATNKNYRLSNAFDFDTGPKEGGGAENAAGGGGAKEAAGQGLSDSLADWRKRLDS